MTTIIALSQLDQTDKSTIILFVIIATWVILISVIAQTGGWFAEQIFLIAGLPWPWWSWAAISSGQTILLLLPLWPLARRWRHLYHRRIYQTWALASLFLLCLIPVRLTPLPTGQSTVLPQIGLTLLYGLGCWLFMRQRDGRNPLVNISPKSERGVIFIALLLSPALVYPWAAWGALGSGLDFGLNLVAGLCFGLAAAVLLQRVLINETLSPNASQITPSEMPHPPQISTESLLITGCAISVTLLILVSGLSLNGLQLLLMLSVPASGWALASLHRHSATDGSSLLSQAIWLSMVTSAPLAFLDADELVLILSASGGEILQWALLAALVSIPLSWILGLPIIYQALAKLRPSILLSGAVMATWLGGVIIYALVGQPGFHGDHLFVILKEQADLSAASTIKDVTARRRYVYERLVQQADASQADLRAALEMQGAEYRAYYLVNAIDVTGGPLLRRRLAARPDVDRVLLNPTLRPLPAPVPMATGVARAPTEPGWNLKMIGADRVWQEFGVSGAGVVIGQSDSGVAWEHPELRPTYRGQAEQHNFHWLDPWYATAEPTDIGGHGTHTLGSIVGQTTGVAPEATWFACANLPRNLANPALYLDCLQFMLAPYPYNGDPFRDGDPAQSADILNNSWGCPPIEGCDADALLTAANALRSAGIFVVVSAGNEGPNCETIQSPFALYEAVFSVGAIDEAGQLAGFSSRGPVTVDGSGRQKPDIVAPGVEILSAFPGNSYERTSGTSMAGPHVAGVVALIWSARPDLIGEIKQTELILRQTAQPLSSPQLSNREAGSPDLKSCGDITNAIGSGIINVYAAVQMALDMEMK